MAELRLWRSSSRLELLALSYLSMAYTSYSRVVLIYALMVSAATIPFRRVISISLPLNVISTFCSDYLLRN